MRAVLLLLFAALATPAAAQPTAPVRNVAFELREGGRIVAVSQVRLRLGRPAAVAVDGPYAVRLRIDETAAGFTVRPNLHVDGPGGWTAVATPVMTMAAGEPVRARIERPSAPALELTISVD